MSSSGSTAVFARHFEAVQAATRAGDMERAAFAAEKAIAEGHEHPHFLTLAAYHRLRAGEVERAHSLAMRACDAAPGNVDALNVLGEVLIRVGRQAEAIPVLERALALNAADAVVHFNLGMALEQNGDIRRACEELEQAFKLDPLLGEAASRLAFLSAMRGDMARAKAFGLAALKLNPQQAFSSLAVAIADIDARDFDSAQARLVELMNTPRIGRIVRALAESVLGDALDGRGRSAEAFEAYSRAGEAQRALYAPASGSAAEMALARTRRLAAYIGKAPKESWVATSGPSPVKTHVFLVGFPRSGTTLLAHVLQSHPDIGVLEEKRTLTDCAELVASDTALDKLARMGEAELAPYREAYWKRAAEYGLDTTRGVFVDKMPLNSELLFLLQKLFPEAKIVFALRDPRDVVLSSFRRRFNMNRQMYELLTLDSAAVFYDSIMSLCEIYRDKLSLPMLDVRNEALIGDFEGETRRLCEFLGVPYDATLARFAEAARGRDITTPSATQVVRGLNPAGMGQWRRYAPHMAGVMPLLMPWVAKLGYAAD